jgi:hypothetical protein
VRALEDPDNGLTMMRLVDANEHGRLYAIGHQSLRVFLDYLGGLRISFEGRDGSLRQTMVLSSQEAAGLRRLLNEEEPEDNREAVHRKEIAELVNQPSA